MKSWTPATESDVTLAPPGRELAQFSHAFRAQFRQLYGVFDARGRIDRLITDFDQMMARTLAMVEHSRTRYLRTATR